MLSLTDALHESPGPVLPEEATDGLCQSRGVLGRDDEPGLFVRDRLRETAYVRYHHRTLEVGGDLSDAALRGRYVGLHHEVGVAQIATHFERPMVVTDVGGLAETIPHEGAGFIVPPEDPPALAKAIRRFFREDWAGRLVEGVRERKHAQQPERLFEAIEDLLSGKVN